MSRYVRFDYFRIVFRDKDMDAKQPDKQFDFLRWMEKISKKPKLGDRLYTFSTTEFSRLENYQVGSEEENTGTDYYYLHFARLRPGEDLQKAKKDDVLVPLDMGADEYLGEEVSALFDAKSCILMLQNNRYSLGQSGIEKYLNHFWESEDETIFLRPVLLSNPIDYALKGKGYKKFRFRVADSDISPEIENSSTLKQALNAVKKYKAPYVEITISTGRTNAELEDEEIDGLITELIEHRDIVNMAEAKIINQFDASEVVNLFEQRLSNFYLVREVKDKETGRKLTLNHEVLWKAMYSIYHDGPVPEELGNTKKQKLEVLKNLKNIGF